MKVAVDNIKRAQKLTNKLKSTHRTLDYGEIDEFLHNISLALSLASDSLQEYSDKLKKLAP